MMLRLLSAFLEPGGPARRALCDTTARAPFAAASTPAPFTGSDGSVPLSGPLAFPPAPPVNLAFSPLPPSGLSRSASLDGPPSWAQPRTDAIAPDVRPPVSAAVPPTGRRSCAEPRSRSPSPKRRSPAARAQVAAQPVAVTLQSLAAFVASGFKDVTTKITGRALTGCRRRCPTTRKRSTTWLFWHSRRQRRRG